MGATAIRSLTDVDRIFFNVSLDGLAQELAQSTEEEPTRWVHVASAGDWYNMARGQVVITIDDIKTMWSNFKSGIYPQAPTELPVDYEHLSTNPNRKPGDGVAAAWFKDLEVRENGLELWGLVSWLKDAAEKIRSKQYRGFSPTLHPNWITHGGRAIGPTLIGGALTNYPTMPLRTVTLSLDDAMNGESIMSRKKPAATELPRRENMKLITVKNDKGEDVSISLDSLGGLDLATLSAIPTVKDLAEKAKLAPGDDEQVVKKTAVTDVAALRNDITTLSQTVNTLKATNDAQAEKITTLSQQADAAKKIANEAIVDGLIREGKALPAERDLQIELAGVQPALFEKWVAARKALTAPIVALSQNHGSGGQGNTDPGDVAGKADAAKLVELAQNLAATEKISYATALLKINKMDEHKELVSRVRAFETPAVRGMSGVA